MRYVDGYVLVVPEAQLAAYRKMAEEGAKLWKKYGALDYIEAVGQDLDPDANAEMKRGTFPAMAGAKPGETIIFSYILFESRQHRDEVNSRVMADPSMAPGEGEGQKMPFDLSRMAYGGFEVMVEG